MQSRNVIETIMGGVVLLVAAGFLTFAYTSSQFSTVDGYRITAKFESVSGLAVGSDVRVGGIKVGVITNLTLDPATYQAVAHMQIRRDTKLPKDSTAAVVSNGLLGEKYVELVPGTEEKMIADGGTVSFTQSSVNLEQLIGKFMFSGGGVEDGEAAPEKKE